MRISTDASVVLTLSLSKGEAGPQAAESTAPPLSPLVTLAAVRAGAKVKIKTDI